MCFVQARTIGLRAAKELALIYIVVARFFLHLYQAPKSHKNGSHAISMSKNCATNIKNALEGCWHGHQCAPFDAHVKSHMK